jgi:E3 ubiquitin-protein ligase CHFR
MQKDEHRILQHGDEVSFVIPSSTHKLADTLPSYLVRYVKHDAATQEFLVTQFVDGNAPSLSDSDLNSQESDRKRKLEEDEDTEHSENKRIKLDHPNEQENAEYLQFVQVNKSQIKEELATEDESLIETELQKRFNEQQNKDTTMNEETNENTNEAEEEEKEKGKKPMDEATKRMLALFGATSQDLDEESQEDDLLKELSCGICSEVFYKPVSVVPCLHNFCAPCFSEWRDSSHDTCPQCRGPIRQIRKNHGIANLVEGYLKMKPHLRRSAELLEQLDRKNTITDDILRGDQGNDDGSDDSDNEDSDEDTPVHHHHRNRLAPFNPPFAVQVLCRECATANPIDNFQCTQFQVHVNCTACRTMMPVRDNLPPERTQQCRMCLAYFCNLYFGSPMCGTQGLHKLSERTDVQVIPSHCLSNNQYEREILLANMRQNNTTPQQVYNTCMTELRNGTYHVGRERQPMIDTHGNDAVLCRNCTMTVFSDLVFDYRKSIPQDQLPRSVTGRADCWYGRDCRTQSHNSRHASSFNHACDNTSHQRGGGASAPPSQDN